MALVACEECGHQISDRAVACPNCGFPIARAEIAKVLETKESDLEPTPPNSSRNAEAEFRVLMPTVYKVALSLGVASVFFGGTFGLLAWAAVAVGSWALYSKKVGPRRWMAWTGLGLGIVFSFMNAYLNGHLDSLFNESNSMTAAASPSPFATSTSSSAASPSPSSSTFAEGMTLTEFVSNWHALVETNELGERWMLSEVRVEPDSFLLGLRGLESPITNVRGFIDTDEGSLRSATLDMLNVKVSEPGYEAEIEDLITAWQLFCYSLDGPRGPNVCAEEVAEGLGYPFDTLRDWTRFHDAIELGSEGHFARSVRDQIHWQIWVVYNGIIVGAGLEPTG